MSSNPYRVAIAISGAVSLGSYEAGTLYELIAAIAAHNTQHDDPAEQIKIDVLTGASAGGMTAALVAQKLLYEASSLSSHDTNAAYNAWVKLVDIDGLLGEHPDDKPHLSLLSTGFVGQITNQLILDRYTNSSPPKVQHPASADQIKLGLAMSNLNGVDFARDIFSSTHQGLSNSQFIETCHEDRFTQTLDADTDKKESWTPIVQAARACGAFPLAFPPLAMKRLFDHPDYAGRGVEDFSEVLPQGQFVFMDGGAFNNYPLGMARELAKTIDDDPVDYERRFYFYISPNSKSSTMDPQFNIDSPDVTLLNMVTRMASAIFTQARFQDWLQTDKINRSIELLDEIARDLVEYIRNCDKNALTAHHAVVKKLVTELYTLAPSNESLDMAIVRLGKQYQGEFTNFARVSKLKKEAWLYSIALFEKSARLHDKDTMNVYTITSSDDELASEKVMSFMGFLDERFREHDYLRGRLNARIMLNHILDQRKQGNKSAHIPLDIAKFETQSLEDTLNNMKLVDADTRDVDLNVRKRLYERLKQRVYLYMENIGMNYLLRLALFNFVIRSRLKTFLSLSNN